MSAIQIDIPDDIARSLKMPAKSMKEKLTIELSLQLYQQELLSFGKARTLAGLSRWAFADLLGARGIARHYSESDLAEDLGFARED